MSDHDVESNSLDIEYRQILYIIKSLINNISEPDNLQRYIIWLDRLSAAHPEEKFKRNRYLLELAIQIHNNTLDVPFTFNPPKGLLPPLRNYKNLCDEYPAQISEHFFLKDLQGIQWPYLLPRTTHNKERHHSFSQHVNTPTRKTVMSQQENSLGDISLACDRDDKRHRSLLPILQKKKSSKHKTVRPFQKIGKTEDATPSETTSWCDLTDTTSATQTCGADDGDESRNILSTQHKDDGLKIQERFVKKFEETKSSSSSKESRFNVNAFLASEERIRRPTEQEVEALKMRMKDLLEVKNALRDTHCLTEDRKKTIEILQTKLSHLEQQNSELVTMLDDEKKKFVDWDDNKNKEISDFKEKFAQMRQTEIENLKQYHRNEVYTLEKSYTSQISQFQTQMDCLKKDYDENLSLLKQKEEEIQQLRNELKVKISEPSSDGKGEQVINLRRCISKLDKALHKTERDYTKKVEKLRQELDFKDVTSQMQLQTQRVNLILHSATSKQEEFKSALNSLEGKYKEMLETLQMHALEAKRHDDKLIDELKTLLIKNNIRYC